MSGCHVILANDKPCGNYARNKKTCCWVHRKFESLPYTETDKPKKVVEDSKICEFIRPNGCRCKNKKSWVFPGEEQKYCGLHKFRISQGKDKETILETRPKNNYSDSEKTLMIKLTNLRESDSERDSDSSESEDDPRDKTFRANLRKPVKPRKPNIPFLVNTNGEIRCQYIIPRSGSQCLKVSNCQEGYCYIHMPLGSIKNMKV